MATTAVTAADQQQVIDQVAVVEATGGGFLVCGAYDKSTLEKIVGRLTQIYLDDHLSLQTMRTVRQFPYEEYGIPPTYLESLQQPFDSANYHLQQGGSRYNGVTCIDWWTFIDDETRLELMLSLFDQFVASAACAEIAERGDIETALDECYPLVGQNGVDRLLKEEVWTYLKERCRNQLSAYSRRAITNGSNGEDFEAFFEQLCDQNGLECTKRSGRAFARYLPEAHAAVQEERGSMKGIPDYFVDKGNTHSLNHWMQMKDREWAPDDQFAFVECKYNDSHLSPEQREMVESLTEQGLEVYLFRGTDENYRFVRID